MTTYAEPTMQIHLETAHRPEVPTQAPAPFTVSMRGYERAQVDHHLRGLLGQMSDLREALRGEHHRAESATAELSQIQDADQYEHQRAEAAEAQLTQLGEDHEYERRRAEAAETEVALLRARLEAQAGEIAELNEAAVGPGYGHRMEKLIRAAELEAERERAAAAQEAAELLEQARADAASCRNEAEHALVARTASLERLIARTVALDERERALAQLVETAHAEADRVLGATTLRADALLAEARSRADRDRERAERSIARRRAEAAAELERLKKMCNDVRAELARLVNSVVSGVEAATQPPAQTPPRLSARPSAQTPTRNRLRSNVHAPTLINPRPAAPNELPRRDPQLTAPMPPATLRPTPHRHAATPESDPAGFLFQSIRPARPQVDLHGRHEQAS